MLENTNLVPNFCFWNQAVRNNRFQEIKHQSRSLLLICACLLKVSKATSPPSPPLKWITIYIGIRFRQHGSATYSLLASLTIAHQGLKGPACLYSRQVRLTRAPNFPPQSTAFYLHRYNKLVRYKLLKPVCAFVFLQNLVRGWILLKHLRLFFLPIFSSNMSKTLKQKSKPRSN